MKLNEVNFLLPSWTKSNFNSRLLDGILLNYKGGEEPRENGSIVV